MEFGFYPEGGGFLTEGFSGSPFVEVCVCGSHAGNRREGRGQGAGGQHEGCCMVWAVHPSLPLGWRGEGRGPLGGRTNTGGVLGERRQHGWHPDFCLGWARWGLSSLGLEDDAYKMPTTHPSAYPAGGRSSEERCHSEPVSVWVRTGARPLQKAGGAPRRSWGHRSFLIVPFLTLDC